MCKYCEKGEPIEWGSYLYGIIEGDKVIAYLDMNETEEFKINYCPMCGKLLRKFKTNDELIDFFNEQSTFIRHTAKSQIWNFAIAEGSDYYLPNVLHVERVDEFMIVQDDEEACKVAEKEGVPFICDINGIPEGVYVDTMENRNLILEQLEKEH